MRTTSKYIQLTDYALLEYEYNSDVISTDNLDFLRIKNSYSGSISYLNYNASDFGSARTLTGNSLDFTTQQVDESKWVRFDFNRPLSYFESQNPAIEFEHIWAAEKTNIKVVYDKIKIHIISGYNFEDLAGLILRAAYVDRKNGSQIFVLNYAYLKEDTHITLNPTPLLLGDRIYDKYIEVKIPSLKDITDVNTQIADIFSPTDNVFLTTFPNYKDSNIGLVFYEIKNYEIDTKGQTIIKTALPIGNDSSGIVRVEIPQLDSLSSVSALVQESKAGDYFELFPTYNGEFIEDFIYNQAQTNNQYTLIHDIELYEQVSTFGDYDEILTQKLSYFQEAGFDKPFKYRPIIENPNAVAFTIDYTVRLFNKLDNTQIIRRASLTYPNANKYGRWLEKINIPDGFQPLKIVNKIVNTDNLTTNGNVIYQNINPNSTSNTTNDINVTPSYILINSNDIFIESKTLFTTPTENGDIITYEVNKNNEVTQIKKGEFSLDDIKTNDIIYGQGDAIIYLSNFDNFIKFKLFKKNTEDGKLTPYSDMRSTENINFYIVFESEDDEKIRIAESSKNSNINIENEQNELIFRIDTDKMNKILKSNSRNFYITIENTISDKIYGTEAWNVKKDYEVVLYSGKFDNITNFKESDTIDFETRMLLLDSKFEEIEQKEFELITTTEKIQNLLTDLNKTKNLEVDETQKNNIDGFINTLEQLLKDYNEL